MRGVYPVVGGVPVLIDDAGSVFAIEDYVAGTGYEGPSYGRDADRSGGLRRLYRRAARRLGDAASSIRHPDAAAAMAYVAATRPRPRVLVVGSGGLRLGAPLQSISDRRAWRLLTRAPGLLCTPLLRLLDRALRHGADAAGGCWFLGRLHDGPPVADRALVRDYRAGFGLEPACLPAPTVPPTPVARSGSA